MTNTLRRPYRRPTLQSFGLLSDIVDEFYGAHNPPTRPAISSKSPGRAEPAMTA